MELVAESATHVYHIYAIKSVNRVKLTEKLAENQIGYGFHYPIPVHKQTFYAGKFVLYKLLPETELLASQTLSIPIFPKMTDIEIERVISVINSN
jgi:dTDP-4-amino-4,6-dideoxygalactose transaminase